ncbi:MAG: hypothetical protein KGJ78_07595 [Alphaproteobacteria bacterium]|nr:hypothetical protein [Alphaproteobacteria bacterium]
MMKSVCLAVAAVAVLSAPALADSSCGSPPIAPAIPGAADLSGKTVEAGRAVVVDAYHQVKAYQAALKPYRDCLAAQESNLKQQIAAEETSGDKDAKDKVAAFTQQAQNAIDAQNKTVDTEGQVANDFNTLHTAQCVKDTDPKICPKKP